MALAVLAALVIPASAGAATTVIDTTTSGSGWNVFFGPTYDNVGETISVPADAQDLESFSFFVNLPSTVPFKAYVYEWDPLQTAIIHPTPLYASDVVHTAGMTADGTWTEEAFDTGGVLLDPAKTYLLLISTWNQGASTFAYAEGHDSDAYAGGKGYTSFNDPTSGPPWTELMMPDQVNGPHAVDFAFKATFDARPLCFSGDQNTPDALTHPATPVTVPLDCRVAGPGAITVSVATPPAHGGTGTVTQASGSDPATVQYTPANGFNDAVDTFQFQASNADGTSDPADAFVHVGNLAPTCTAFGSIETLLNTPLTFEPECTDPENDPLTFVATSPPSHGTVTDNGNGTVTYTPAQDYTGQDEFTGHANDGALDSNPGTVSIDVFPPDHPPVCKDVSASVDEKKTVTIQFSCSDPDGDAIGNYRLVSPPTQGLVLIPPQRLGQPAPTTATYTERSLTATQDTFTYAATAGGADSAPATVTISITHPQTVASPSTGPAFTPPPLPPVRPVCTVPKLVGKTLKQAKTLLTKAHCALGKVTRKAAGKRKRGRVLRQRPGRNTNHPVGTKVALTVGR